MPEDDDVSIGKLVAKGVGFCAGSFAGGATGIIAGTAVLTIIGPVAPLIALAGFFGCMGTGQYLGAKAGAEKPVEAVMKLLGIIGSGPH
jgi:hypothetical protein